MISQINFIKHLYSKYKYEIVFLRAIQKERIAKYDFKPHFDDIESEILYMIVREFAPNLSIEFSPYYGYSTTWILSALEKNKNGVLKSFDIVDYSLSKVNVTGLANRWELSISDVTTQFDSFDYSKIDFAFIDSDHSRDFAKKYIDKFLHPLHLAAKENCKIIPIITHDIYSWETGVNPTEEGEEVLIFLKEMQIPYFTASCFFDAFSEIKKFRAEIGIEGLVHETEGNPSILYFLGVNPW